ncbi:hypothetical protein [Nocardioides houyundeii]|uniref:hypothetical protein n=1 Tax=Nocardioides houyundeii TaxID=2045452 RepID=UPI000C784524|nr:hypothetical protein [Nocardioides houyundeii]
MSDTASPSSGAHQMSQQAAAGFRSELEKLRANSGPGPRDKAVGAFGIAMVVIGLVVILVAYNQATSMPDVRDQLEMVILGGFGTALAIVGGVVYAVMSAQRFMRFWLLRVIFEQRDLAARSHEGGVRATSDSAPELVAFTRGEI